MKEIEITKEPVELYKILKFEGIVASGGEAKAVIDDGQVLVNGEIETRKRKKIVFGDTIEFMNAKFKIVLVYKSLSQYHDALISRLKFDLTAF